MSSTPSASCTSASRKKAIRGTLWAADLTVEGPPPSVRATRFAEISPSMPAALVAAMGEEGDRVVPRFERGCRAFVVLEREAVVAYGWLSRQPEWVGELGVEIRPAANEAYIWNCFTLAEHRRHGHYRSLLEGIVAASRRDGLARLWIGSIEHPAEKADAEAGFVAVAECLVTTVLGWRWLRVRAAPGADLELMRAARARMALAPALALARRRIH